MSMSLRYIIGGKRKLKIAIVDPPIKLRIAPKSGIPSATMSSKSTIADRIVIRFQPISVEQTT